MTHTLFNIPIRNTAKNNIREKVDIHVRNKKGFFHIVSLNPEIIVESRNNKSFLTLLQSANIHILDGIGVVLTARLSGVPDAVRITGVDLMTDLVSYAADQRLRILFLGGSPGLAEKTAQCYMSMYPEGVYKGIQGISDISKPDLEQEEKQVFDVIDEFRPDILFVAFGSPQQELWLWKHRTKLMPMVCMGVGGGFDFVTGVVPRAPGLVQQVGLEWLFRLVQQPWRWKRQTKLMTFIVLAAKEVLARR